MAAIGERDIRVHCDQIIILQCEYDFMVGLQGKEVVEEFHRTVSALFHGRVMSDSSVPYPFRTESIIWFFKEAKFCNVPPGSVKSPQATTIFYLPRTI